MNCRLYPVTGMLPELAREGVLHVTVREVHP